MPQILSVGTAVPVYSVSQDQARQFAYKMFNGTFKDIERLLPIFENAEIDKRHFSVPIEWFEQKHDQEEINRLYIKNAQELAQKAILNCLKPLSISPEQIDYILFVSTTGLSTPSMDARLINLLDMNPHIKRTPIWGLGCAGGAAGLSRASEYIRAFPQSNVLLVSVELCGLTFLPDDLSKSNLIATSLFADGAAAVLISGDQSMIMYKNTPSPRVIDTCSIIWKDTLDVMGWDITNDGLKVVFSRDIPNIVEKWLKPQVQNFLHKNELSLEDITYVIAHPGGMKVLNAYQKALQIGDEQLQHAMHILKNFGNMSSASVLFVLKKVMADRHVKKGDYGLITALGPGFSGEFLLVKWD